MRAPSSTPKKFDGNSSLYILNRLILNSPNKPCSRISSNSSMVKKNFRDNWVSWWKDGNWSAIIHSAMALCRCMRARKLLGASRATFNQICPTPRKLNLGRHQREVAQKRHYTLRKCGFGLSWVSRAHTPGAQFVHPTLVILY